MPDMPEGRHGFRDALPSFRICPIFLQHALPDVKFETGIVVHLRCLYHGIMKAFTVNGKNRMNRMPVIVRSDIFEKTTYNIKTRRHDKKETVG